MSTKNRRRYAAARRNRRPRGWTLIEMVIYLSIGALVFGTSVEFLGVAMRADSSGGRAAQGF